MTEPMPIEYVDGEGARWRIRGTDCTGGLADLAGLYSGTPALTYRYSDGGPDECGIAAHGHSIEAVLAAAMSAPSSFSIPDEYRTDYSAQEIELVERFRRAAEEYAAATPGGPGCPPAPRVDFDGPGAVRAEMRDGTAVLPRCWADDDE